MFNRELPGRIRPGAAARATGSDARSTASASKTIISRLPCIRLAAALWGRFSTCGGLATRLLGLPMGRPAPVIHQRSGCHPALHPLCDFEALYAVLTPSLCFPHARGISLGIEDAPVFLRALTRVPQAPEQRVPSLDRINNCDDLHKMSRLFFQRELPHTRKNNRLPPRRRSHHPPLAINRCDRVPSSPPRSEARPGSIQN